jgi:hypothetical protein
VSAKKNAANFSKIFFAIDGTRIVRLCRSHFALPADLGYLDVHPWHSVLVVPQLEFPKATGQLTT